MELLKFDDINKINYYIKIIEEQKLSVREVREKIRKLMKENKISALIKN